jgi:hypothetical protein
MLLGVMMSDACLGEVVDGRMEVEYGFRIDFDRLYVSHVDSLRNIASRRKPSPTNHIWV